MKCMQHRQFTQSKSTEKAAGKEKDDPVDRADTGSNICDWYGIWFHDHQSKGTGYS